jgi:hypothetical protein
MSVFFPPSESILIDEFRDRVFMNIFSSVLPFISMLVVDHPNPSELKFPIKPLRPPPWLIFRGERRQCRDRYAVCSLRQERRAQSVR